MKFTLIFLCFVPLFTLTTAIAIEGNIYNSQYCNGSIYATVIYNPIGCVQFFPGTYYQVVVSNSSFSVNYCNNSQCTTGCTNGTLINFNTCYNATDPAEGIVNYGNFTKLDALPTLFGVSDQDTVAVYYGADSNCTYPGSANEVEIYKPGCQLQNGGNNQSNSYYALITCSADKSNITFATCINSNCTNCTIVEIQQTGKCVNSNIGGGYTSFYCGQVTLTAPNTTANSTNNTTVSGTGNTITTSGSNGGTTGGVGGTTGSVGSGTTTDVIPSASTSTSTGNTGNRVSTSTTGINVNSAPVFSYSVLLIGVLTIFI